MKRCPACGTRDNNDLLVVCPACGAAYDDEPSPSAADLSALETKILKRLTGRVSKFIFGGFSIFGLISAITILWQFAALWNAGMSQLQTTLNKRIDEEFKTERIQKTIADVAKQQAGSLLRDSVQPQIDKVRSETEAKVASFDAFLKALREQNKANFGTLNSELGTLKERNRLMQLADRAVNDGDRKALDELMKIKADPQNPLVGLAGSLIFQVKNFYLQGTKLGDYKLVLNRFGLADTQMLGNPPAPESYSVGDLIFGLQDGADWRVRAKSADLLGTRRTKSVPEALLVAVKTDGHLEVVRNALRSFVMITGYVSPDVFEYQPAEDWWREHADEINRNLTDL